MQNFGISQQKHFERGYKQTIKDIEDAEGELEFLGKITNSPYFRDEKDVKFWKMVVKDAKFCIKKGKGEEVSQV